MYFGVGGLRRKGITETAIRGSNTWASECRTSDGIGWGYGIPPYEYGWIMTRHCSMGRMGREPHGLSDGCNEDFTPAYYLFQMHIIVTVLSSYNLLHRHGPVSAMSLEVLFSEGLATSSLHPRPFNQGKTQRLFLLHYFCCLCLTTMPKILREPICRKS